MLLARLSQKQKAAKETPLFDRVHRGCLERRWIWKIVRKVMLRRMRRMRVLKCEVAFDEYLCGGYNFE